jgi:antitoxin component YwqK of YwqJK toxin-antitoxin module
MKIVLNFFIFFLLFSNFLSAQIEYYPNGKVKEHLDPKTNVKTTYYDNGNIKTRYKWIKPTGFEGEFVSYYSNGNFEQKGNYKKGKKDGLHVNYYESGNKLRTVNYLNDLEHGEYIEYYENGNIKIKKNYLNGKILGQELEYFENGNLSHIQNYKNGFWNGEEIRYYENGKIKNSDNWINGIQSGESIYYYSNGNKETVIPFKNGKQEGETISYFEDGKIAQKGIWKNGEKVGTWLYYNNDGSSRTDTFSQIIDNSSNASVSKTTVSLGKTNSGPKKSFSDKSFDYSMFKPWNGNLVTTETFAVWVSTLTDVMAPKYNIGINPDLLQIKKSMQTFSYAINNIPADFVDDVAAVVQMMFTEAKYTKGNVCKHCKKKYDGQGFELISGSYYPNNCDIREAGLGAFNQFHSKNCALLYCKKQSGY